MILFEVFWRISAWFHKIRYNDIVYDINSAVVISVVVESSRRSPKTLQKGSCPYAPLDDVLRYDQSMHWSVSLVQNLFPIRNVINNVISNVIEPNPYSECYVYRDYVRRVTHEAEFVSKPPVYEAYGRDVREITPSQTAVWGDIKRDGMFFPQLPGETEREMANISLSPTCNR